MGFLLALTHTVGVTNPNADPAWSSAAQWLCSGELNEGVGGGKVLYESPLNTQPFRYRRSAGAAGSLHDRVMETEKILLKGSVK